MDKVELDNNETENKSATQEHGRTKLVGRNLGNIGPEREEDVLNALRKEFPKGSFRTEQGDNQKLRVILEKDTLEVGGEGEVERMESVVRLNK